MEQRKEYYAFISYRREDEKWAKWLQHKLEHYKFPTNLNGRTDLPKNIRPTFRDVTDLKPGLLAEEINNALLNSEWLIVVCSPRAAKSPWVCKEAQTFIDLGRADHIIPFVIEGNPFSNDTATECYPEALLNLTGSKELLAANINEMGRDAAAIKVVARMFGLRFDSLWQRYERQKRKRRILMFMASITVIALSIFIALVFRFQKKQLQLSQSRFIAERAEQLIEEGDSYLAQLLLLEVLPDGSFDDRPYAREAELALRKALRKKTMKLPYSDIACYDVALSIGDKHVIARTQDDTAYVWETKNGQLINKFYLKDYPSDVYDIPDSLRRMVFITSTRFFFADSVAHVWDIETGKHLYDLRFNQIILPTQRAKKSLSNEKYIYEQDCIDGYYLRKWDSSLLGEETIIQKTDGYLYIKNKENNLVERINIANPEFAFFSIDTDVIYVITDESLFEWSRSLHEICREIPCSIHEYPYSDYWERLNVYFNKDMTKVVINNYIQGGKYDLAENWVLYDLNSYMDKPIISYNPILFSNDGKMCIYNKADMFWEKPDYCIMNFEDDLIVKQIDTITGDYRNSSNKKFYVTNRNNNLYIYNCSDNLKKKYDYSKLGELWDAEISFDGKYILSCHETVVDTFYSDFEDREAWVYYDYYLWDMDKSTRKKIKNGSVLKDFVKIHFNLEGKIVTSSGDIYDVTGRKCSVLQNQWNDAEDFSVSSDGKYYVYWNGWEVRLWDANSLKNIWTFVYGNPYAEIGHAEFSPSGKEVLVNYRYGFFLLDVETGKLIDVCAVGETEDAFFSYDGQSIYIKTCDDDFYKYNYPSLNELIKRAKNNLKGRRLTKEERIKYHLD